MPEIKVAIDSTCIDRSLITSILLHGQFRRTLACFRGIVASASLDRRTVFIASALHVNTCEIQLLLRCRGNSHTLN